jgi:putative tryptophan/tyrosine transport system substrate-binding protein
VSLLMDRRRFLLISLAGALARPPASEAQATLRIPRVGYLSPVSAGAAGHVVFRQSMRELGYVEGQSIAFREGFANGYPDRMLALAMELVREHVDVIVAASPPAIRAAKEATRTIPIVIITGDDPVRSGFVVSLARPGGNITGVTFLHVDLPAPRGSTPRTPARSGAWRSPPTPTLASSRGVTSRCYCCRLLEPKMDQPVATR